MSDGHTAPVRSGPGRGAAAIPGITRLFTVQFTTVPSWFSAATMCVTPSVGVAPCQCLMFGPIHATSPGCVCGAGV